MNLQHHIKLQFFSLLGICLGVLLETEYCAW